MCMIYFTFLDLLNFYQSYIHAYLFGPNVKIKIGMHRYCEYNQKICWNAVKAIESGSVSALASAMIDAQQLFDNSAIEVCPSELTSPKLHKVMSYAPLKAVSIAIKGVGSQGGNQDAIYTIKTITNT